MRPKTQDPCSLYQLGEAHKVGCLLSQKCWFNICWTKGHTLNEYLLNNKNIQLHKQNIINVTILVFTWWWFYSWVFLLFCPPPVYCFIIGNCCIFFPMSVASSWLLLKFASRTLTLSPLFWTLLLPLPTLERIQWMFTLFVLLLFDLCWKISIWVY